METVDAFRELVRISLGDTGLDGVLARVADLAGQAVPGADEVSVTLVRDGGPRTVASTGTAASILDEWQYTYHQGPCLDAAADRRTVTVGAVAGDRRWPGWAEHAGSVGVRSALSVGLPIRHQTVGALNLYATTERAFDAESVELAQAFAGYAAVALSNADLYDTTAALVRQMQAAMESRAVIEQAKGIVMGQRGCGPDEAFAILARVSQDANRKLRDVATDLVARTHRRP
ncbi:GAF and ANTAR domain-containing protein [Actinoplanes couchii]|uniref:Transcriptional regulator n=1 Tax=Actinoplanes couchii TaxID=403638 RepID=A0ABQ3X0E2_9ACTN|nr:GAF and ANTAR domain-containing protein [Actinoplanes couchii]MDR6316316.1 GAF domain-containing protein [Actinoplanes couchii]GID51929.1 transcriptional regulator [Actinoplanes couchii]